MLDLITTGQYKKDCRRMEKRGSDMTRLDAVVEMLRRAVSEASGGSREADV